MSVVFLISGMLLLFERFRSMLLEVGLCKDVPLVLQLTCFGKYDMLLGMYLLGTTTDTLWYAENSWGVFGSQRCEWGTMIIKGTPGWGMNG